MAIRSLDNKSKDLLKKKGFNRIALKNVTETPLMKIEIAAGGVLSMQCKYESGLSGAFSDNRILRELKTYASSA